MGRNAPKGGIRTPMPSPAVKLPVVRDSSTGRRNLRAKQELALESSKAYADFISKQIGAGLWSESTPGSDEEAFLDSIRDLRKAERADHTAWKTRSR